MIQVGRYTLNPAHVESIDDRGTQIEVHLTSGKSHVFIGADADEIRRHFVPIVPSLVPRSPSTLPIVTKATK